MIDGLYNTDILSLAANISHVGKLEKPCGTARKVSKLCGSWIEIDICVEGEVVTGFAVRLQACALGQASTAILAEAVIGATAREIQAARDGLYGMLKQGGEPQEGRFSKLALLSDVANYPARHISTLLAFDAVLAALENAGT